MLVNPPVLSASGIRKTRIVFIHNLIACSIGMRMFRWPELMYDIVMTREVAFSRSSTRLKRRLEWEGKEVKKKVHILVFVARIGCSTP